MQNRRTENEVRISEIARIIDELSTESNQLLLLENQADDNPQIEDRREIIVGDTVEITNEYCNQLGEQGIITKVTRAQVTLTRNSTGHSIRKKKSNVRIVLPTEQDLQQEQ